MAEALRGLAAAVQLLPGSKWSANEAARKAADRLSRKPADPVAVELARSGLSALVESLAAVQVPPEHGREFRTAVASLDTALDSLDPGRGLAEQGGHVTRALRAAGDAVLIAGGAVPRFGLAQPRLPAGSDEAFAACVVDARAAVHQLAAAAYPREREAVSRALAALADCVVSAPGKTERVERLLTDVRFEVARIRAAQAIEPMEAAWITAALSATLDALAALPAGRRLGAGGWLRSARRSIRSIEEDGGLVFQRARIQDAFRATVDALAAARAVPPAPGGTP